MYLYGFCLLAPQLWSWFANHQLELLRSHSRSTLPKDPVIKMMFCGLCDDKRSGCNFIKIGSYWPLYCGGSDLYHTWMLIYGLDLVLVLSQHSTLLLKIQILVSNWTVDALIIHYCYCSSIYSIIFK